MFYHISAIAALMYGLWGVGAVEKIQLPNLCYHCPDIIGQGYILALPHNP